MKLQRIKNQNKRAIERARGVKALKREYGDMSIDEINEISLKDAAAIANQNEKLKKTLGEKRLKLKAELDMANVRKKHEIQQKLDELDALAAQVRKIKRMGGDDAVKKMKAIEQQLKLIDVQTEHKVKAEQAKGKNKVAEIEADGRTSRFRKAAQAFSGLFKGFGDKTKGDVESANNSLKIAQKKLALAKTQGAKKTWERANKKLAKLMESHEYNAEQKAQLAQQVVQEALRQIEKAK